MKRIVANKILLITTLALFIFASFSVFTINYLNIKMQDKNLMKIHEVYELQLEKFVSIEQLQKELRTIPDSIRVTVATSFGDVIADNLEAPNTIPNISQDRSFAYAIHDEPKTTIARSRYYKSEVLQYGKKIVNKRLDSQYVVLIVSVSLNFDSTYFTMMIPILFAVFLLVIVLTYTFTNSLIKNALMPLTLIQTSIQNINKGEFKPVHIASKYKDVQNVVEEINVFNSKIANSVKYLTYEQQKSNFILDNMSQGIIALSPNNDVVLTNRATLGILEATKNLLGCNLSVLISDPELSNRMQSAILSTKNMLFMYEMNNKVYKIEVLKVDSNWYKDEMRISTLITLTDVTSESNSAKIRSEFFANASHELKTPLTAVKGFSELLSQMPSEDGKIKCAEEIVKNTDRMLVLIDDMLKLSKIDANIVDFEADFINLREIVDKVVGNIIAIALKKQVEIIVSGEGSIFGSISQIEEVVTNLIDNAIKYNIHDGKVFVTVEEKDDIVYFIVEDTGIGIEAVHQSRIFERFYIVEKGRNRKVQSTGLGLAIVKHIVLQHSGKIALESAVGKGTKFIVQFPSAKILM